MKNFSPQQEVRAFVANKLTLPLLVFEMLQNNKKVGAQTISKAQKDLKNIMGCLDKMQQG